MNRRDFTAAVAAAGGLLAVAGPVAAQSDPAFQQWLRGLRAEAMSKGVDAATLDRALRGVEPVPRVLELDRHQPEFKLTYQKYLDIVVSEERVNRGRAMMRENAALLDRISGAYGVPSNVIVALWGAESLYGSRMGDFSVVAALATLAYHGRRPQFFRSELIAALRILAQGHIAPDKMIGSWAGAMGQCQFMPTSFLAYAVDGDGDGRRDIWGTRADVFASTANYLRKAGWQTGLRWGDEVPAGTGAAAGGRIVTPEGAGGRTYRTTQNFRAILRWNQSDFFALGVGLLSDRVAR
ncbi:MAG: lytic murein transglycosylase [Rhodospirillales bacterium]|nr:MAG: lytic murein transglycosylase [Rhodospirillales bacterium]